MKLRFVALAIFGCLAGLSCMEINFENNKSSSSPLNPNGDSELALLMRDMFDNGMKIKEQIAAGERPEVTVDFEQILTAEATEPEMKEFPGYETYARYYIQAMNDLKNASPDEAGRKYADMVEACTSCHQSGCQGPLVRIKKLSDGVKD